MNLGYPDSEVELRGQIKITRRDGTIEYVELIQDDITIEVVKD